MIRSMIGLACVFFFITTCIQSSAAQPRTNFRSISLRSNAAELSFNGNARLTFQSISDSLLSSDAYHDDFRFRAAPVKRSANWQMPTINMRPAKQIAINFVPPKTAVGNTVVETSVDTFDINATGLIDFVRKTAFDASKKFCQLQDQFEEITLAVIPRPIVVAHGQKDYWNYYADCDRWDVVFAVAWQSEATQQQGYLQQPQETDHVAVSKSSWDAAAKLAWKNAVASWQSSWDEVADTYERIAQQFLASDR